MKLILLSIIFLQVFSLHYENQHHLSSCCPTGYNTFGYDCHSICPDGLSDQGLFCRLPQYGRGAGYPWKFGDGFNDSGQFSRCERDNGRGKCQKYGLIVYPMCKAGYLPFGCCICRPVFLNCFALGLNPGIDLSCSKKIIIQGAKC